MTKQLRYLVLCATSSIALTGFAMTPVMAQSAVSVPGSADIGQTDKSVPTPDFARVTSPEINIPEIRVENAPDGAENIKFTLNSITLEGVTAYPVADLQQIWGEKIGTTIALTDIYAIAQKITRKYRTDGYIITQAVVPQQTIDNGDVVIRVVEGFIDNVTVQEDENSASAARQVRKLASNLTKESPLTAEALERWLLLVNDIPGLSARSIISPSQTTIGGADLVIIPTVKRYNANITMDNYGSRYLGPFQASVAGQVNDLFGGGETFQAQFLSDDEIKERIYGYGRMTVPTGAYGTIVGMDYTKSKTKPGFRLDIFDVDGESEMFGIDVTHPLIRSRTQNLYTSLRFDYRNLRSTNIVDSFATKDKISALRFGMDYSLFDTLMNPAVNEVGFTLSQGLDVLGSSNKGDANMTRSNGDPQFTKLEMYMSRIQTLTPTLNLMTGLTGQWANNPLLSSEEFGVGGRAYGRGYDVSELVGDDGFGATVELRWNPENEGTYIQDYEFFAFYDFGKIWNQETDVDALENRSLASAGLGLRTDFNDTINGEFIFAYPLTKEVDAYDSADSKFLFSLGANF